MKLACPPRRPRVITRDGELWVCVHRPAGGAGDDCHDKPCWPPLQMSYVGGNVPPPLVEISVNDRQFKPQTAKVTKIGQRVRYKIDSNGSLNHLLTCGDLQSPLLRPGTSWILDTATLTGTNEVQCEVTCMKMHVVMEASAEERPLPPAEVSSNSDAAAADGADEEGQEEYEEDDGIDEEMLEALRAKLNISPTLKGQPSMPSGAGDDDDDEDDAQFIAARERHAGIKKSREL